jgi:hypothetical protein
MDVCIISCAPVCYLVYIIYDKLITYSFEFLNEKPKLIALITQCIKLENLNNSKLLNIDEVCDETKLKEVFFYVMT